MRKFILTYKNRKCAILFIKITDFYQIFGNKCQYFYSSFRQFGRFVEYFLFLTFMDLEGPIRNITNLMKSLFNAFIKSKHFFQMINFLIQPFDLLIVYLDVSLKLRNKSCMITSFNCGDR
jgi:hypothetical protein